MNKNYLIIFHHKTGCVLSRKIINLYHTILTNKINIVKNNFNDKININYSNNIVKINYDDDYSLTSRYNFYFETSPFYLFNIFNVFKKLNKIVHFVRDPFEQAISNFIYHTQVPTPEKWFLNINLDIDSWFNNEKLNLLFDFLRLNKQIIENSRKYLKKNYKFNKNKSYYSNLLQIKKNNLEKAIILETLRFIFCSSHVLKMAIILKKNNKFKGRILNLFINDFNDNSINNTINRLSEFLFNTEIDNRMIVNELKKSYKNQKNKGVHVNNKSGEYKKKLENILKKQPIINRIFQKVQNIMKECI